MTMNSSIYAGRVDHWRRLPHVHRFGFKTYMLLLDLTELPTIFAGRWFWGVNRPALATFHDCDHLKEIPNSMSLRDRVLNVLQRHQISTPIGSIRLLTQLRHFGFGMSPVSFFYCFDEHDDRIVAIIAEVNNTPWGEQHLYVIPARGTASSLMASNIEKNFHVSPFMPMTLNYRMRFSPPDKHLSVTIENFQRDLNSATEYKNAQPIFSASMKLERLPLTTINLTWMLIRFPAISLKIFLAIYWQAFVLYMKGIPVFKHPGKVNSENPTDSDSIENGIELPVTSQSDANVRVGG